jgi:hypothetical protein
LPGANESAPDTAAAAIGVSTEKLTRESTLINADLQNAVLRVLAVKKSCVKTSPLINTDLQEHD